jgi:hypothetical protein
MCLRRAPEKYIAGAALDRAAIEYAIGKVQENQALLKLNGTHQLLAYADLNILGNGIDIMKKNIETLIDATHSKEVGLHVILISKTETYKETPWPESAKER